MSKQVYISADYAEYDGDRDVVEELNKWGSDNLHKVDFIDMSKVASGSVSKDPDCRICDLKQELTDKLMLHLQLSLLLEIRLHCVQQGVLVSVLAMIKVLVIVPLINKIQMVRNHVRYFLLLLLVKTMMWDALIHIRI